ncbi:MAG: hypothetical protein F7B60_03750 [Desulfurococcales archaeon]|nr:hypothetical protein [Desulfurococcales archaeon]
MCDCKGLEGWSLVKCLAPPRGEYEVIVKLKIGSVLAVNNEGFFLRVKRPEGGLPFISTDDTPVNPKELDAKGLVSWDEVLCDTVNMLLKASTYGSSYAKKKIEDCKYIVKIILENCV